MRIDIEETAEILLEKDKILIICHASPDGDTLGSGYGLCLALQRLGKLARVICDDEIPACFSFVPDGVQIQDFEPEYIVAVDVAAVSMLGSDQFTNFYKNKIDLCIDHHISNTDYAPLTCIEETMAAAAAETILLIINKMGVRIDREIAECIYVGLSTDTGCFRFSNTTSRTMRMAADMIDCGIDIDFINKLIFDTHPMGYMKLSAMALDNMISSDDGKIALIFVTKEMFDLSGCPESEFHGLKSVPITIEGVKCGICLRETKKGSYKVSVRTVSPYDANAICKKFGGGGHIRASGCEIFDSLDGSIEKIIAVCREFID